MTYNHLAPGQVAVEVPKLLTLAHAAAFNTRAIAPEGLPSALSIQEAFGWNFLIMFDLIDLAAQDLPAAQVFLETTPATRTLINEQLTAFRSFCESELVRKTDTDANLRRQNARSLGFDIGEPSRTVAVARSRQNPNMAAVGTGELLGVALGNAVTLNFLKPVGTPDLTIPQAMSGSLVAMIEALHLAAIDLQTALGYLDDKPEHRGTIQTALDNYRVPVDKWLRLGMVDEGSRVSSLAGLKLEVKRMDLELDF